MNETPDQVSGSGGLSKVPDAEGGNARTSKSKLILFVGLTIALLGGGWLVGTALLDTSQAVYICSISVDADNEPLATSIDVIALVYPEGLSRKHFNNVQLQSVPGDESGGFNTLVLPGNGDEPPRVTIRPEDKEISALCRNVSEEEFRSAVESADVPRSIPSQFANDPRFREARRSGVIGEVTSGQTKGIEWELRVQESDSGICLNFRQANLPIDKIGAPDWGCPHPSTPRPPSWSLSGELRSENDDFKFFVGVVRTDVSTVKIGWHDGTSEELSLLPLPNELQGRFFLLLDYDRLIQSVVVRDSKGEILEERAWR